MASGDTPQQQLKRARLDHTDSEHWASHGRPNRFLSEQAQPVASDGCPDTAAGEGVGPTHLGLHQGGQHFHWMPVFCQMPLGGLASYEGLVPGSLAGSWVQSMPSMHAPAGIQGGLQSYPCVGPQPGMPAAAATAQPQPVVQDGSPAMSAVDSRQSPARDVARTDGTRFLPSAMQQQTQEGTAHAASDGPSSNHKCVNAARVKTGLGDAPLGMAACLPKLEKQLSNRSCEDLTAKTVAKLWGVSLRRYTGRGN